MNVTKWPQQFKKYYQASAEHRTGVHLVFGFFIIPVIVLSSLYFFMLHHYL
jgi:hypothetical protein